MSYQRLYTETTTGGTVREVYGKVGGGTCDTYYIEYNQPLLTIPHGIPINPITNYK